MIRIIKMDFHKNLWTVVCFTIAFSFPALAINVFKADDYFSTQQYELAKKEYSKAAGVGSPHAYYQLGTMYYKGLGTKADKLQAMIWFALAAEYQFNDAEKIVKDMLKGLPNEDQAYFNELVLVFRETFGKQTINQQYFPIIVTENLPQKITFGGEGKLENNYQDPEMMFESFSQNFSANDATPLDFQEGSDAFGLNDGLSTYDREPTDNPAVLLSRRPEVDFTRRPYFLIVDHDVATDGSVRNISRVQNIGYPRSGLELIERSTLAPPTFEGTRVEFFNRSYLGTATYSGFQMKAENERLYDRIRRLAKKLRKSTTTADKYQYAMALLAFTWLPQEVDEAENILKKLALSGHPKAQFEYGFKLYREQKDIKEAIHWLSEASKYGMSKAEYVLGSILHKSPWVINDEKKALFWYESAIEKGHVGATLKAIELKLLAVDETLHDVPKAIELLAKIEETEIKEENPEYYFLLAISHKNRKNRNFSQVVKYMKTAIDEADSRNWDVTYWEGLLEAWTTGTVQIID